VEITEAILSITSDLPPADSQPVVSTRTVSADITSFQIA